MVDWAKKKTFLEKIMIDGLFKKHSQVLVNMYKWKFKKIAKLYDPLNQLEKIKSPKLTYSGIISLNLAGKWRLSDCREKISEPIIARAIYNMEAYNFETLSCTLPSTIPYQWLKKDFPETLQEIQTQVQEGKWNIIGGDLVNYDASCIDGESLIRQKLYGQRFIAAKFSQLAEVAWFDCYSELPHILAQIMSKSGIKSAFINVLDDPKDKNKGEFPFPFVNFMWTAHDHTSIAVSAQSALKYSNFLSKIKDRNYFLQPERSISFNRTTSNETIQNNLSNEVIPAIINPYGAPNTKFGPLPFEIMEKMLWEQAKLVENVSFKKHFEKLHSHHNRIPTWGDAILFHRNSGIYTTAGMMKENNHTSEVLLHQTEALSAISGILGREHFQDEIQRDWQLVLKHQYREIIGGNSICEVIRDAAESYHQVISHLSSGQENAIMNAAHFLKKKIKHDLYTLFNPLGWKRHGFSTVYRKTYNNALDHQNKPLFVQKVSFSPYLSNREMQLGVKDVPGQNFLVSNAKLIQEIEELSFESQKLLPTVSPDKDELLEFENLPKDYLLIYHPPSSYIESYGLENTIFLKSPSHTQETNQKFKLKNEEYIFNSQLITIKIDANSGIITHLSYDDQETNLLGEKGIQHTLYHEKPSLSDPIHIDPSHYLVQNEFPALESIEIEERGPLRHTILIKYNKSKDGSRFHSRISIYRKEKKIYGETLVDWREKNKFLKLEINSVQKFQKFAFGKPYSIEHQSFNDLTTRHQLPIEMSFQQFALCYTQKLENETQKNLVLYSQGKYGLGISEDTVSLSLLRAPKLQTPDSKFVRLDSDHEQRSKYTDHGFHRIPWAIECVEPEIDELNVLKQAYEYNFPMIYAPTNASHDKISFFKLNQPNVIITTVKEIEEFMRAAPDWFYNPSMYEIAVIVRCVEFRGIQTSCTLSLPEFVNITKVFEVDLLERIQNNGINNSKMMVDENSIQFPMKPHEIKSLMVIIRVPFEEED
ncbi:hypothetical protein NEF87_000061 [Candidatus Lokiarchaeum ossiferum]|uniref:Glycoside hydrolase family 38 central domain-containing protein n=1 Tax=Candidatus Lokiarchaeum ossiferum TaxID=2951803 RepID=A0ABY6HK29_9ARCH|nr:hypothetical protein NEF87_000061 [Candidatus Lokiarchaeum sp. B-35]